MAPAAILRLVLYLAVPPALLATQGLLEGTSIRDGLGLSLLPDAYTKAGGECFAGALEPAGAPATTAQRPSALYNSSCTAGGTTVCNYQRTVGCTGASVLAPETEDELRAGVLAAAGVPTQIRAIGRPHSDNRVWCDRNATLLLMHGMGRILGLSADARYVTVEAGARLADLNSYLHAHNRSLGAFYPAYSGLTVGGILGTGAHGSSTTFPSALGSALHSADVMNARGVVVRYTRDHAGDSPALAALQTHLGVLGVVVRVTLATEPVFKMHVVQSVESDSLITNGSLVGIFTRHDWVYLGWYRKVGKVILRVGDRVPADTPGDCKTDFITPPFPRVFLPVYAALNEYAVAHPNCSCELEYVSLQAEQDSPPFVDPEGRHHASSVGFAHDMLASDCAPLDCPWANGLRVEEMEIAVPLDRGQEALDVVSGFFHGRGAGLCFPLQGVWLRGARGDASFLGFGAQGAPMLVIGLTSWRPSGGLPRYHEDAYRFLSDVLMDRFNGRPHWAKNMPSTFHQRNWTRTFGAGWAAFLRQQKEMDPDGLFLNDFARNLQSD